MQEIFFSCGTDMSVTTATAAAIAWAARSPARGHALPAVERAVALGESIVASAKNASRRLTLNAAAPEQRHGEAMQTRRSIRPPQRRSPAG